MAAISQTTFSNTFAQYKSVTISIWFSLKFVLKGPIDNKSALVQVMACRLFGADPFPEPMLIQFTYVYMQH